MIDVDDRAEALVRRFEGLRLEPYLDPVGVWTIGYGATRGINGQRVTQDHPAITEGQARIMLERDLQHAAAAVERLVTVPLSPVSKGALTSFAFNCGNGALRASTLLKRVNSEDWGDVPAQFGRWVYAGGVRMRGLIARREAESALFMEGIYGVGGLLDAEGPSGAPAERIGAVLARGLGRLLALFR